MPGGLKAELYSRSAEAYGVRRSVVISKLGYFQALSSPLPLTRYTKRCSSVIRRDHHPLRSPLRGSGFPIPSKGILRAVFISSLRRARPFSLPADCHQR